MYKVIGHPRSRAMRVIWLLEELEQPYEIEPLTPWSERLLAIQPEGKIPVLETAEGRLTDSVAMMLYLADKHGGPDGPTHPAGGFERAVQDGHALFIVDQLEGPLWSWSRHRMRQGDDSSKELEAECRNDFDRGVERLAARVGDGPFLMGDRFTLPEILAGHAGGWAKALGWPIENEAAAAYLERVFARPSNTRARERAAAAIQAAEKSMPGR